MGEYHEASVQASRIHLTPDYLGVARIDEPDHEALNLANELLQKNHDEWHMYFQDIGGHNHIPHSLMTVLAMGGGKAELERAYSDGEPLQRPIPSSTPTATKELSDPQKFKESMVKLSEYTNFLKFFESEIDAKGWKAVVSEYCFSGTPNAEAMFAQLFEGLYHPLIHLGFGIEFNQPSIVAEGLAQAASHWPGHVWTPFFTRSEALARSGTVPRKPLSELFTATRNNETIRTAGRIQDGPMRGAGVLSRALEDLIPLAAQFQVDPDDLELRMAEMLSCSAFTTAAQWPGKQPKCDFFYLHMVTSGLFVDIMTRQDWISVEHKARLLDWKARLDLTWYAANGCPEMKRENITEYQPTLSKGMDWRGLYRAANQVHDDGHIVKFIRALKNAEERVKVFEGVDVDVELPVTGDMWFRMAQLCYDGTAEVVDEPNRLLSRKWVFGAGYAPAWKDLPDVVSS